MSEFKHYHLLFLTILFLCLFISVCEAQGQSPKPLNSSLLRGFFSFGDSYVDVGNNNYLEDATAKSNFPPYGQDFVNQQATGRFSNGLIFPDFLANSYLSTGILPKPYLGPLPFLVTTVSFGSGGTGFDSATASRLKAIPMLEQLGYFIKYKQRLMRILGKKRTQALVRNSLFYVNGGTLDLALGYFNNARAARPSPSKLPEYLEMILGLIIQFIQALSREGAQRILVNGIPPLGCTPLAITTLSRAGSRVRSCLLSVNSLTRQFNLRLQDELKAAETNLSSVGTKIVYVDFYEPLLDIIQNPSTYGFSEVNKGCCGSGLYEIGRNCNETTPVCADDSKYVFWDAAHPCEKAYKILFNKNFPTIQRITNNVKV